MKSKYKIDTMTNFRSEDFQERKRKNRLLLLILGSFLLLGGFFTLGGVSVSNDSIKTVDKEVLESVREHTEMQMDSLIQDVPEEE